MKKLAILCLMAVATLGFSEGFTLDASTGYKAKITNTVTHSVPSSVSLAYGKDGVKWDFKVEDDFTIPYSFSTLKVLSSFGYTSKEVLPGLKVLFGGDVNIHSKKDTGKIKGYVGMTYQALPNLVFGAKTKYESIYVIDPKYVGEELTLEGTFTNGSVKGSVEFGTTFKDNLKTILGLSGKYTHKLFTYDPSAKATIDHTFTTPETKTELEFTPISFTFKPVSGLTLKASDYIYSNLHVVANKLTLEASYGYTKDKLSVTPSAKFEFHTEAVVDGNNGTKYVKVDDSKTKANADVAFKVLGNVFVDLGYQALPELKVYSKIGVEVDHNMFLKGDVLTNEFKGVTPQVKIGVKYNF